jgi:hypothetical protein
MLPKFFSHELFVEIKKDSFPLQTRLITQAFSCKVQASYSKFYVIER